MARLTAVPVEEYLRTTYEPDMEYVAGQLVERHVGEHFHSRLQTLIIGLLAMRERERRFRTFTALRIRVSDEPRYRVPDICVKALPYEITPILTKPDLAIEILSPDDEPGEILEKIGDYLAAGIPYIWVADPYKRRVEVVDQAGIRRAANLKVSTPLVGEVEFGELFEQLYEPAE